MKAQTRKRNQQLLQQQQSFQQQEENDLTVFETLWVQSQHPAGFEQKPRANLYNVIKCIREETVSNWQI